MPNQTSNLHTPPWTQNAQGATRRVGVELEISGLELDALSRQVATFFGLRIEIAGRYERRLTGDAAGDWGVELDFDLLKKLGREPREDASISAEFSRTAEDLLAWAAEALVPLEIVSPPLPLDRLQEIENLIVHLRAAGAKGTSDSPIHAFGMQFNPELPSLEARQITACLKSFACLYDWLFERANIDLSRRLTAYVDPYPSSYVHKLIADDYWPDQATLINDYLADNPTRNRALDMLPLFLFLDEPRVRTHTTDVLIKARPTFHYRLPDCDIHKPHWGLHLAWNDWVEVERLAADAERLRACCAAYRSHLESPLERFLGDWVKTVDRQWLAPTKTRPLIAPSPKSPKSPKSPNP